ncbi:MAG TPA: hypothetical protein VE650_14145 [Acetobacteraceae bacterium]|jgi:hypothetical protein|nr:hypothetical protein [Acetobacteraceae bacterium]
MPRKAKEATTANPLERVETHVKRGEFAPAIAALLPVLERRAEAGDRECRLAAAMLRHNPIAEPALPRAPDALSATLDRLVLLVQRQEEQIRTLRGLIEDTL